MNSYKLIYQEHSQESLKKLAYHFEFDYASKQNPYSYTQNLVKEIELWKKHHIHSEFFSVDLDQHLVLVDFRPIRTQNNLFTLTGLKKVIFQLCDNIISYNSILDYLEKNGIRYTEKEIKEILNEFVKEKLILTEYGKYLNVAVPLGNYSPKKHGLERLLEISNDLNKSNATG
jgi:hypothetical protein